MDALAVVMIMQSFTLIEEEKKFNESLATLPQERANKLRKERKEEAKKQQEIRAQHSRDLEVARAGRTVSFWDYR